MAERDEKVIAAYNETSSAHKVVAQLGVPLTTVYRILQRHGIERHGLEKYREEAADFRMEEAQEIRRKYESGIWLAELIREYGGGYDSIISAIRRAGGKHIPAWKRQLSDEEEQQVLALYKQDFSQQHIARTLDRAACSIERVLRKHGVERKRPTRAAHHAWKGGKWVDESGYQRVMVPAEEHHLSTERYEREHRLVMARHLGRALHHNETIHHINGDKLDNRLENLELRHGKHGAGVRLVCLDCGSHNIGEDGLSKADEE